jgi:hypothetical protein
MSTKRRIDKDGVLSVATKAKIAAGRPEVLDEEVDQNDEHDKKGARFYQVFTHLVALDHGYLKTRRDGLKFTLHLTWTWTTGKHHGSYVYVAVDLQDFDAGFDMLARKILDVDEGHRLPTPDRRNSQYRPTAQKG